MTWQSGQGRACDCKHDFRAAPHFNASAERRPMTTQKRCVRARHTFHERRWKMMPYGRHKQPTETTQEEVCSSPSHLWVPDIRLLPFAPAPAFRETAAIHKMRAAHAQHDITTLVPGDDDVAVGARSSVRLQP